MAPVLIIAALIGLVTASRFVPTPDEVRASFDAAQKFYASEDYEQAIDTYDRINAIESPLLYTGTITAAVGAIEAPVVDLALYQTGNSYFKRAEDRRIRAARAEPDVREVLEDEVQGDFGRAVQYFRRAESETAVIALKELARNRQIACLYESGMYDGVVEEGRVFVEEHPQSPFLVNVFYNIGWAYFDTERYAESITAFRGLTRQFPTGYRADRALFQIGEAHFNQGQFEAAVPWYRQVVDRQNIGVMSEADLLRMRREKVAGLVDETALELAAKAQIKIGDCFAQSGDPERAAEAYRTVITAFAQERRLASEARIRLADMYTRSGDLEAAARTYRDAIDGSSDRIFQAGMQSLLAEHYYRLGEFDRAIAEYELFVEAYGDVGRSAGLAPDAAEYKIGRARFELGERHREAARADSGRLAYEQAIASYATIARDYPNSDLNVAAVGFNTALCYQMMGALGDAAATAEALRRYAAIIAEEQDRTYVRSSLFQLARIHYQGAHYEQAISAYERILASKPDDPQRHSARFELALCYRDLGEREQAVTAFNELEATSGLLPRAMLESSQLLAQSRDYDRALEALERGLEASEDAGERARLYYTQGRTLMEMEEYGRAIPVLEQAGAASGEGGVVEGAAYGRGVSLFKLERYGEAVAQLEQLLASDNAELEAAAQRMIGLAHLELGREQEAVATYTALLEAARDEEEQAAHLLVLAELHYSLGAYGEVKTICRRILAMDLPDVLGEQPYFAHEKAYFLLGDIYGRRQERNALITTYEEALERYPSSYYSADMMFALGEALFRGEDLAGAARVFGRFREDFAQHPNLSYALYYLGYARFNLTEFDRAAAVFGDLAQAYPESELAADALFRAGEASFNLEQFEVALDFYEQVLESHGDSDMADDALYNLAWSLLNLKQEPEALAAFARLSFDRSDSPLAASAQFTIGDYHYNKADYERSLEAYREVTHRFPDSEVAVKVPAILADLREVVAYLKYTEVESVFVVALEDQDPEKFRRAIAGFSQIAQEYPGTESEIGALSNMGVSHESLGEWKEAVQAYDKVLDRFAGAEAERYEAYRFARMHKEWIEASRL